MKNYRLLIPILTLCWTLGLAINLQAAQHYRFYTTGQGNDSEAVAINDNNQVVVNFNDRTYLWTLDGGLQDLGDLGGGISTGYAINNQGQIVGTSIKSSRSRAFFWQSGTMQDLGVISGGIASMAKSINNLGKVLGISFSTSDPYTVFFTWTLSDGINSVDLQGGSASKIADDGSFIGSKNKHAWLWRTPGAGIDLGTLPAPFIDGCQATDINPNGQVVGYGINLTSPPFSEHAFSWTQNGGIQDLGTLGGPSSQAFAINSQGYIVGGADTSDDLTKGCMWTPDGKILDLDTLVINKPAGVEVGPAYGINNQGVIVGMCNDGPAYMLVPVRIGNPAATNLLLPNNP